MVLLKKAYSRVNYHKLASAWINLKVPGEKHTNFQYFSVDKKKRRKLRKTSVKELLAQEPFWLLTFDRLVMLITTISLTKLMNMRRL